MINLRMRKFRQKIARDYERHAPITELGLLGDASGTVRIRDHWVWVTLINGDLVKAWNQEVPNSRPGLHIELEWRRGRWYVTRALDDYDEPVFTGVVEHADTHARFGGDVDWVDETRILPGLVTAYSGMTVAVYALAMLGTTAWKVTSTQYVDLTSYIPASGANWLLLEMSVSGAITATAGASVSSRELLTDAGIPMPVTSGKPLAAVKMYFNQTDVVQSSTQNDIRDLRWGKALDPDLAAIAALNPADNDIIQRKAGVWTNCTPAQYAADLTHGNLLGVGTNTHAQIDTALTRLANTSGTNTGDQDLSGYVLKSGSITQITTRSHTDLTSIGTNTHAAIDTALSRLANTSGSNTGDQDLSGYVTKSGSLTQIATRNHSDLSGVGTNTHTQIDTHLSNTSNPHSTTIEQARAASNTLAGDINFAKFKAVAMACDSGATLPSSPAVGQWFLHTPTGRSVLMQYANSQWNSIVSFGAMTIYVDKTNGTDSADKGYGTTTNAFKTLTYMWARLPAMFNGNITVYVSSDTYNEVFQFGGKTPAGSYSISIVGSTTTLDSGTMTSSVQGGNAVQGTGGQISSCAR